MTQMNISMRRREQTCGCQGGWGKEILGVWDGQMQNIHND